MSTSIIQYTDKMHIYGGEIWNGSSVRYLKLIVVYDERGPINTNYTASGCGDWLFETKRRIPMRTVDSPNWTNPNGFIVKANRNYWDDCNTYTLFVNRDNIPDESYVEGKWERYMDGAAQKVDLIGGCEFNRIVGNAEYDAVRKRMDDSIQALKDATEGLYYGSVGSKLGSVSKAYESLSAAYEDMLVVSERIKSMTVDELVEENGGNRPINERDWCGIAMPNSCAFLEYIVGTYEV